MDVNPPVSDSTLVDVVGPDRDRPARAGRRVFLAVLTLFIVSALAGAFGRESTSSTGQSGNSVTVTAPAAVRAGMDANVEVAISSARIMTAPITIAVEHSYLSSFTTLGVPRRSLRIQRREVPVVGIRSSQDAAIPLEHRRNLCRGQLHTRFGDVEGLHRGRAGFNCRTRNLEGPLVEIVLRAAITFFLLWLITRAVGRSTLGELSSFELLLFITMGDLVQQGVTQEDHSVTGGLIAVGTMALLTVMLGYVNVR